MFHRVANRSVVKIIDGVFVQLLEVAPMYDFLGCANNFDNLVSWLNSELRQLTKPQAALQSHTALSRLKLVSYTT